MHLSLPATVSRLTIQIWDAAGRDISTQVFENPDSGIDLHASTLASGYYILGVTQPDGSRRTNKVRVLL
jgi:hypothetical protein